MKTKKSKRANLENKRGIIFQAGLVIALSLVLAAFEWNSEYNRSALKNRTDYMTEAEWDIVNTFREEKPKPKLPTPKMSPVENLIISEEVDIEEEFNFSSEADESLAINIQPIAEEPEEESAVPFYKVEEKPQFVGGEAALLKYLAKHTIFPKTAVETGINGRVYVNFVINEKGKIENVTLARGVHPLLDKEAIRVVRSMPDWIPGIQGGKRVAVKFTVPINFKLQ